MRPLTATVLTVDSRPRRLIYGSLLREPGRDWTVSQLAAVLPGVSVEAVRTTLHLLLGDRLVDPVPRQRALTLRLTAEGTETLQTLMNRWTAAAAAARQSREAR